MEFISKHPAIAGGVLIIMLSLVKLAAVTHYDPTTMLALANTVGATSILTGTFFSPPWPGLLVLTTLCIRWFLLARSKHWYWVTPAVVAAFFALLLAALLPPLGAVIFASILLVIGAERAVRAWSSERLGLSQEWRVRTINVATALVLLFVVGWSAFFNSTMWLPKEIIFAQGAQQSAGHVIEGYVLGSDGKWISILVSGHRKIRRMPVEWIKERTVCLHHRTEPLWWTKLPWLSSAELGEPPEGCREVRLRTERAHPGATSTHED